MTIAAQLGAPPRGANARSVAEANARGHARLASWRHNHPAPLAPRLSDFSLAPSLASIDEEWAIAAEHMRWAVRNGISLCDLYLSIQGREPPLGLSPDDVFDVVVRAYRTVHAQPARGRVIG